MGALRPSWTKFMLSIHLLFFGSRTAAAASAAHKEREREGDGERRV